MARVKPEPTEWRTKAGEEIRKARTAKGLSLQDVAAATGKTASSLGYIERGQYYFSQELADKIKAAIKGLKKKKPDMGRKPKGVMNTNVKVIFQKDNDLGAVRDVLEPAERGQALVDAAAAKKRFGEPVAAIWLPASELDHLLEHVSLKDLRRMINEEVSERISEQAEPA